MASKKNSTGFYDVPEGLNQNYPDLSLNVNLISDVYVGADYSVVVRMASGQDHYVTEPQLTYEDGKATKDKFMAVIAELKKNEK